MGTLSKRQIDAHMPLRGIWASFWGYVSGLGRSANASEASVSATSAKQPTGDRVHPTAACFAI